MSEVGVKGSLLMFLFLTSLIALTSSSSGAEPQVIVSLEPSLVRVAPGEEFTISVSVDPGGRGISGGEVDLKFDPRVLEAREIVPGDLLGPEPLFGLKEVDNEKGSLRVALARKGSTSAPTKPGILITVKFSVAEGAPPGRYEISVEFAGFADEAFNDVPREQMLVKGAVVEVAAPTTIPLEKTVTSTLTKTEKITELVTTTLTKFLSSSPLISTLTVTSTVEVPVEKPSSLYLAYGGAIGIAVGLAIGYILSRRKG